MIPRSFLCAALVGTAFLAPARLTLAQPSILDQPLGGDPAVVADPVKGSPGKVAVPVPVGTTKAPVVNLRSLVAVLEGKPATGRHEVNLAVREALVLEHQGKLALAIARLRSVVQATKFADAKARYFLARAYELEARKIAGSDPAKAAEDERLAQEHLRSVPGLARSSKLPEDKKWASAAEKFMAARAVKAIPVLDQYSSGTYPWGYCATTSLRMVLRHEGLADPGADAVALQGAAPYSPGSGSDGALLARRARELGLTGASFTKQGSLTDIVASVERGRPVMVGGDGAFSAKLQDGGVKQRSYPAGHWLVVTGVSRDRGGNVTSVALNDPDGGHRETMTREEFRTFFGSDGSIWEVEYTR